MPEGSGSVAEAERTSFNVCVALTLRVVSLFAEASQRRWTQIGGDVVDIQTEGKYKQSMVPLYNVPTEIRQ